MRPNLGLRAVATNDGTGKETAPVMRGPVLSALQMRASLIQSTTCQLCTIKTPSPILQMRNMRLREVKYLPKATQLVINRGMVSSSDSKIQALYHHPDLPSQAGLPPRPETEE